jgi:hypothetical protein
MRIISFIEDSEIIKKILKHLDLWDVRRKPPARANGPPTEAFIIYDQSSSPGADDYIIDADRSTLRLSTGYPIDLSRRSSKNEDGNSTFKKIQPQGIPVSYAQIGLRLQSRRKKLILTTKPALVIQMNIVCVNGRFNMLGCI